MRCSEAEALSLDRLRKTDIFGTHLLLGHLTWGVGGWSFFFPPRRYEIFFFKNKIRVIYLKEINRYYTTKCYGMKQTQEEYHSCLLFKDTPRKEQLLSKNYSCSLWHIFYSWKGSNKPKMHLQISCSCKILKKVSSFQTFPSSLSLINMTGMLREYNLAVTGQYQE